MDPAYFSGLSSAMQSYDKNWMMIQYGCIGLCTPSEISQLLLNYHGWYPPESII